MYSTRYNLYVDKEIQSRFQYCTDNGLQYPHGARAIQYYDITVMIGDIYISHMAVIPFGNNITV